MFRSNNSESRIYVGNLPEDVRARDVEDLFGKFGKIENLELKQPRGGRGPAFAFLEFDDSRDADDAVHERDGYEYEGQRLRVQFPQPSRGGDSSYRGGSGGGGFSSRGRGGARGRGRGGGPPRRSDYRVLVSGLPPTGSWQDIKDHLREAGEVVYADVFRDGTGVVEFSKRDAMIWACKNLDDSKFKSHENETAHIRVKEDGASAQSRSRSRSRSPRSRSPRRSYSPQPQRRSSPPYRRSPPSNRRSPPSNRRSPPSNRRSPSPNRRSPSPNRRSPSPRRH